MVTNIKNNKINECVLSMIKDIWQFQQYENVDDSCATIQIESKSIISYEKHQQTLSKLRCAIKTKSNENGDIAFDVEN